MKQMATMDLSVIHKNQREAMGMQTRLTTDFKTHAYKIKEPFQETDVKENNNKLSSVKTETDLGSYNPTSLCQDVKGENKMEVEDSLFNYTSFKKAMDLRIHNRASEPSKRTIFDDADYFAKNHLYKLLPITFENVDDTIIHTEHNYCHFSLSSESETEEDCSRTMDYSQIKEKNYKKRKAKLGQLTSANKPGGSDCEDEWKAKENGFRDVTEEEDCSRGVESENSIKCLEGNCFAGQALDLSVPLVQEEKTDDCPREEELVDELEGSKEDGGEFDSDKENLRSNLNLIEVTITRPDEKENYQPCDLFLNDIARLVPRLIGKDCFGIDILDRTCERHLDIDKHRLYYIISESTWRLFQSTKERIILTNDQSLGQPLQKTGINERPTFLVFDQFSLAKCLADYCKEIGGSFEYTCVEEGKQGAVLEEDEEEEPRVGMEENKAEAVEMLAKDEDQEFEQESKKADEGSGLNEKENNNNFDMKSEIKMKETEIEAEEKERRVKEDEEEGGGKILDCEVSRESSKENEETVKEDFCRVERGDRAKEAEDEEETEILKKNSQASHNAGKNKSLKESRSNARKISKKKKKGRMKLKSKVKNRIKNVDGAEGEKEPKSEKVEATFQIRTRSKSTSDGHNDTKSPASQESDKPKVNEWRGKKRKQVVPDAKPEETPKKSKPSPPAKVPFVERKTRSGKTIPERGNKRSEEKRFTKSSNKNNVENRGGKRRRRKAEESEEKAEGGLNLRSRVRAQSGGEKRQRRETLKSVSRKRKR